MNQRERDDLIKNLIQTTEADPSVFDLLYPVLATKFTPKEMTQIQTTEPYRHWWFAIKGIDVDDLLKEVNDTGNLRGEIL